MPSNESSAICVLSDNLVEERKRTEWDYLEPAIPDSRVGLRVGDLLHIRHHRALVARVDNITRSRCQGMAPREFGLGTGLDGDDRAGRGSRIRTTVANDVVGGHISDWLRNISKVGPSVTT